MKTKLTLAILASVFAVGAHAGDLTVTNDSTNAIAVGDTTVRTSGLGIGIGSEAVAGSVLLDSACGCLRNIDSINNTSDGAIAVGNAIAGSVVVRGAGAAPAAP